MLSEDILAAVFDYGSSSIRAGFSGDGIPKFVFPSFIKIEEGFEIPETKKEIAPIEQENMEIEKPEGQQQEELQQQQPIQTEQNNQQEPKKVIKYYVGEESLNVRKDFAKIAQLYRSGEYLDFDLLEESLKLISEEKMKISLNEIPLLMSEASLHNPKQRQKLCSLLFENLHAKNIYFCKQAVLSCFASGRSNSLILDCGAASTIAVPVHDGYTLQKQIVKFDVGGDYLNRRIKNLIETTLQNKILPHYCLQFTRENDTKIVNYINYENTDESFDLYSKMAIIKDIKENLFKVSPNDEFPPEALTEKATYEMPDGSQLTFGEERFSLCECFFNQHIKTENPKEMYSYKGLQYMATSAIDMTDIDLRKELYSNIIICGGNSLLPGFVERLQKKIFDVAPQNTRVKLIAYPQSTERKFSTWLGGSILASLGSFQNLWVTKQEYDEHGPYIVEKKCP